jgi:hypothetical protein
VSSSPKIAQKTTPREGYARPLGVLRRNIGEMMNTPRGRYAPKISASNSLQLSESRIFAKNTRTRVHPKINESKAKSDV